MIFGDFMEDIEELKELWRSRIGLFAKVKWKSKGTEMLTFGIVKGVINKKLILVDRDNPLTEKDIPLIDIIDSTVSELKKRGSDVKH